MPVKTGKVVGIGELLWDVLPDGRRPGGAPANFAFHVHQLGIQSIIVSRVGDDKDGDELIKRVREMGVNTDYIYRSRGHPTGRVFIEVDEEGEPNYKCKKNVAWDYLRFSDEMKELASITDACFFGLLGQRSKLSRNSIHNFLDCMEKNTFRLLDINIRENYFEENLIINSLDRANILKVNSDELNKISNIFNYSGSEKEKLEITAEKFNLKMIALTRGNRGSILYTEKETHSHPGFNVKVKDTVGAGDSFTAALIVGLLRNEPLGKINEVANRVASKVCTRSGATPQIKNFYETS